MAAVEAIDAVTSVVFGRVVGAWGAKEARLGHIPVVSGSVGIAFDAEAVSDLDLEDLDAWLLNGKVSHLDIEAVEVDAIETLVHSLGQPAFADLADTTSVVKRAHLVELTEEDVEFADGTGVFGEGRPEARHRAVPALEVVDDLIEVPREGQDVSVLLLAELCVDAKSGVFVAKVNIAFILLRHDGVRELSGGKLGHSQLVGSRGGEHQSLMRGTEAENAGAERHTKCSSPASQAVKGAGSHHLHL